VVTAPLLLVLLLPLLLLLVLLLPLLLLLLPLLLLLLLVLLLPSPSEVTGTVPGPQAASVKDSRGRVIRTRNSRGM
jgi:hypothetical protein